MVLQLMHSIRARRAWQISAFLYKYFCVYSSFFFFILLLPCHVNHWTKGTYYSFSSPMWICPRSYYLFFFFFSNQLSLLMDNFWILIFQELNTVSRLHFVEAAKQEENPWHMSHSPLSTGCLEATHAVF